MQTREHVFIDGDFVKPEGSDVLEVISPFTEEVVARVPDGSAADMDKAVAAARAALPAWSATTPAERGAFLSALSLSIMGGMDDWALATTTENGSTFGFAQMGNAFASTMVLDYYAGLAGTYHFEEVRTGVLSPALVRREAVGVVAAIVPWNVPLFTAVLKLAPALLAGCTVVLKPAPETPLNGYMLAEALIEIGLPKGVVNIVAAGREVGEHLVRHKDVDKIAFTGSTPAGRAIAAIAGQDLKRCTLELGGKSAAILLSDADLAEAVPHILGSSFMNTGQACVAQTRILAPRDRYSEVVDAVVAHTEALVVGDPFDAATAIGPLVAERQRERVLGYITKAQEEGGKIATGGGRPSSQSHGWYVEPTIVTDVLPGHTVAQEEVFGPVVAVLAYDDDADAVRIANDSDYGLSGTVFSPDVMRALDVARQVRTGTYTINSFSLEMAAPFGGFKSSGLGRELGPEGLEAYLESKSIALPHGTVVPGVPTV